MTAINLPELALSIRQPWAWAVIHALYDALYGGWRQASFAAAADGGRTTTETLWMNGACCAAARPLFGGAAA